MGWRLLGPISSHCRSILVACFPSVRLIFGTRRWIIGGKNPSILEKLWSVMVGLILICLEVIVASASAITKPVIVTTSAANFREGVIVIVGVFDGKKFMVIMSPAMMLPQASRPIGAIIAGLFSLMGDRGKNRGEPIVTKKMTRRL